jgi:NADPH2:quinone reductase
MIAARIVNQEGPRGAIEIVGRPGPEPIPATLSGSGEAVEIAVRSASVSFPELLQSRGMYQYQPPLPFTPGSEVAGVVVAAPPDSHHEPGARVFAFCLTGGFAERVLAPSMLTFALPDELDFAEGAAIFSNYQTAYFALALRGRCAPGETVVVHGAAGGLGTALLQVARGLGLRSIAVVSTAAKAVVARQASADHVLLSTGPWKDEVLEITEGGADLVVESVGDRALESMRALREDGRLLIVGFASGEIPEIKVNRLLLNNIEVVGAGYGAYALSKPELSVEIGEHLDRMTRDGILRPIVGRRFPLAAAGAALAHLDSREALGKVVLAV